MARKISVFRLQVAFDNGEEAGRQFGSRFDPPVGVEDLDALMSLIRNTIEEILNEKA